MLVTIEGIYKDGKVDINEIPSGIDQAKVLITFLPERSSQMGFGMFKGDQITNEEDFKAAEWRGQVFDGN